VVGGGLCRATWYGTGPERPAASGKAESKLLW
jgi:hypothetical protein